jgi:hypothetical protein
MSEPTIEYIRSPEGGGIVAARLTITWGNPAHAAALASLKLNCAEHSYWLGSTSAVAPAKPDSIEVSFKKPVEDEEMLRAVLDAAVIKAKIAAKSAADNPSIAGFRSLAAGFGKPS